MNNEEAWIHFACAAIQGIVQGIVLRDVGKEWTPDLRDTETIKRISDQAATVATEMIKRLGERRTGRQWQ